LSATEEKSSWAQPYIYMPPGGIEPPSPLYIHLEHMYTSKVIAVVHEGFLAPICTLISTGENQ